MNIRKCKPDKQVFQQRKEHSRNHKRKLTVGRSERRLEQIEIIKHYMPSCSNVLCVGFRDYSEMLDFKNKGMEVTGIDVSVDNKLKKHVIQMDAHNISEHFQEKQFDLVYASHCMEHMYDPVKVMQGIRKVSRGLFMTLPVYDKIINPDDNHPCIYDIMAAGALTCEELYSRPHLLDDFAVLAPFDLVSCAFRRIGRCRKNCNMYEADLFFIFKD